MIFCLMDLMRLTHDLVSCVISVRTLLNFHKSKSKKTAYILRHKRDCHEKLGACSWTAYEAIISAALPRVVNTISPYNWLKELTRTTDNDRHEISWNPRTAREKPYALLRRLSKFNMQNLGLSVPSTNTLEMRRSRTSSR